MTPPAPPLPAGFLRLPLAHRALHDLAAGVPENSRAAIRAAIAAGYGIEIDLQLSADGQAMVFHDHDLDRLTAETGLVHARSAAALAQIPLAGGNGETVPTLAEVLALVAGRVPLLIELKDQSDNGGDTALATATARALAVYAGPVAVMSFSPVLVAAMARLAPDVPRGLTTGTFDPVDYAPIPADICARLRGIPDYAATGSSFISHELCDLTRDRVLALKSEGAAILCWTVKSPADEVLARQVADNITFEGYLAPLPA
jgi:glycerophosphoryl diester phosphodiesterase